MMMNKVGREAAVDVRLMLTEWLDGFGFRCTPHSIMVRDNNFAKPCSAKDSLLHSLGSTTLLLGRLGGSVRYLNSEDYKLILCHRALAFVLLPYAIAMQNPSMIMIKHIAHH